MVKAILDERRVIGSRRVGSNTEILTAFVNVDWCEELGASRVITELRSNSDDDGSVVEELIQFRGPTTSLHGDSDQNVVIRRAIAAADAFYNAVRRAAEPLGYKL